MSNLCKQVITINFMSCNAIYISFCFNKFSDSFVMMKHTINYIVKAVCSILIVLVY
jgi:hypothetical protein